MSKFSTQSSSQSIVSPYDLAREALSLIGKFGTPPTPEVYEVWYRYVENSVGQLRERMDYAINDVGTVSLEELLLLKRQVLTETTWLDSNCSFTKKLESLSSQMQDSIETKETVFNDFEKQLDHCCDQLERSVADAPCLPLVKSVLDETHQIGEHISELTTALKKTSLELTELRRQVDELQSSVLCDTLTSVGNRRKFEQMIDDFASRTLGSEQVYLIMIDVDKFKEINDQYGHHGGDLSLTFVAKSLVSLVPNATVCRFGGDEFAVFTRISCTEAIAMAEELIDYFSREVVELEVGEAEKWHVSISGGAALLRRDDTIDSWKNRADRLLYKAKEAGRQQILVERAHAQHQIN